MPEDEEQRERLSSLAQRRPTSELAAMTIGKQTPDSSDAQPVVRAKPALLPAVPAAPRLFWMMPPTIRASQMSSATPVSSERARKFRFVKSREDES